MQRVKLTPLLLPGLLLLSGCGTGPLANPFIQSIEVTLTPSALTVPLGETARVQVTGRVAGEGGAVTGLTITPKEVPAGLSVTPSTGALTVTTAKDAPAGVYSIPLAVTAPGGRGEAVLAVTVPSAAKQAAYALRFAPSPLTLAQGDQVRVSVSAFRGDQHAEDVYVNKVTGALAVTVDSSDLLGFTVQAAADQAPGSYVLQVTTEDAEGRVQVTPLPVSLTAKATK